MVLSTIFVPHQTQGNTERNVYSEVYGTFKKRWFNFTLKSEARCPRSIAERCGWQGYRWWCWRSYNSTGKYQNKLR